MNRKISALSFLGRPEFILLFLILLAGGALRFSRLDFQSLAGDELQTWLIVSGSKNLQDIWTNAKHDTLPPGYNLLLHPFVGIFGDSEKALRSLSAASGFASILILFFLGKLIFSFREGLISCALLSFSLFGIYYSQESRPYSLLLTGTLLTAFFSFELIKHIDKDSGIPLSAAAGYVLSATLNCYLHYFGFLSVLLAGTALQAYSILKRRSVLSTLFLQLLIFIFYLPWIPVMLFQLTHAVPNTPEAVTPKAADFLAYLIYAFNNKTSLLGLFLLLALYALIREIAAKKNRASRPPDLNKLDLLLWCWLVLPWAIVYGISLLLFPFYVKRYLIICLPAVYLLAARFLVVNFRRAGMLLAGSAVLLLFYGSRIFYGGDYYGRKTKTEWREMAGYVSSQARRSKETLIVRYSNSPLLFNYYFKKNNFLHEQASWAESTAPSFEEVCGIVAEKSIKEIWVLLADREDGAGLIQRLQHKYRVPEKKVFLSAEVYRWMIKE